MTAALIADIEGYAAVFHAPDLNGDVIAPEAFAMSMRPAAVRMLYQHAVEAPIGRWTGFRQDAHGLFIRGEMLLASPRAREVHALLQGGAIDGLSIGYQTRRAQKIKGGRRIVEADLWEVSVVTFPMAPKARITRIGDPRPEYDARDYADAFTRSVRTGVPQPLEDVRAVTRASGSPPPEPDACLFAKTLTTAKTILSV
ncbi:HK97 family phage prohead protease [Hyphococcus sp.]|uniref:HK97 family phage prohead protease n=1 Tax=Hyphococcus sp. TaxID=2038636 RepID=UPI003CCB74D5